MGMKNTKENKAKSMRGVKNNSKKAGKTTRITLFSAVFDTK